MKYNFNFNQCQLAGRVANDPQLRQITSAKSQEVQCLSFDLAVNKKYGKSNKIVTLFIECQAWNQMAVSLDQFIDKGCEVFVSGHLETDFNQKGKIYLVIESYMPGPNAVDNNDVESDIDGYEDGRLDFENDKLYNK